MVTIKTPSNPLYLIIRMNYLENTTKLGIQNIRPL
jgi:hypothetical protein